MFRRLRRTTAGPAARQLDADRSQTIRMARPREFDEEVLRRALHLFWDRGYEGASRSDLVDGMGLTKSSLYRAFGSKEGLFRRALESDHLGFRHDALAEASCCGCATA